MFRIYIIKKSNTGYDINFDASKLSWINIGERVYVEGMIKKTEKCPITPLGIIPNSFKEINNKKNIKKKRKIALAIKRKI